jgi:Anti-sigma-K factor rskA
MAAAFDRATKVDGARQVGLTTGSGATLARLVLLPGGTGYLRGDHLAPLSSNQTYQLWAVTGGAHATIDVSAGVLGSDPQAVSFRASGPVRGFAVTIERAGGVVQPTHTPIAQAALT